MCASGRRSKRGSSATSARRGRGVRRRESQPRPPPRSRRECRGQHRPPQEPLLLLPLPPPHHRATCTFRGAELCTLMRQQRPLPRLRPFDQQRPPPPPPPRCPHLPHHPRHAHLPQQFARCRACTSADVGASRSPPRACPLLLQVKKLSVARRLVLLRLHRPLHDRATLGRRGRGRRRLRGRRRRLRQRGKRNRDALGERRYE